jgi:hypothetical protein
MLSTLLWSSAVICYFLFWEFSSLPPLDTDFVVYLEEMPNAWDMRYVRDTETTGRQVALLRRSAAPGVWLAYFPDDSIKGVVLTDRKTLASSVKPGIAYAPLPVGTSAQRTAICNRANAMIENGVPLQMISTFVPQPAGFGAGVRRMFAVAAVAPKWAAQYARWSLRSPIRFLGVVSLMFLS